MNFSNLLAAAGAVALLSAGTALAAEGCECCKDMATDARMKCCEEMGSGGEVTSPSELTNETPSTASAEPAPQS
jgi:hypothetical protein